MAFDLIISKNQKESFETASKDSTRTATIKKKSFDLKSYFDRTEIE